ncbi:kinase-like domain-containing protein [Catenaria anguillulae PL171]|uniref:Kinase-like domain-containing protein n=1 Tax=Catenaria anguillulae PL171 TaxID=765915 RepID=A0A1Y2HXM1_9FUNG|nr:kinase-like domain-containing protein [Catenaria anguillulae PL171]
MSSSTASSSSSPPTPIATSIPSGHATTPTASSHTTLPLIPFSDLILQQELGRGHFGRVLLADYLGTQVAAKEVFHNSAPASPGSASSSGSEFAKYFAREVDTLTAARHPNCVQFMGIAHDPVAHKDYILTEYLPGGNLADHWIHDVDGKPDLAWRVRVGFAIDVARALAYLHARDIMHRDLKGQNLLVTENRRVKVCDFGLARVRAKTAEERKRMSYCGTDAYMAPEIMLCTDFDASVDTFSYGVFLLELVTRRRAELFPRPPQLGLTVDTDALVAYRPAECPPAMWALATECVDVNPKLRPSWKHVLGVLGACEVELVKKEMQEQATKSAVLVEQQRHQPAIVVHVGAEVVADEHLDPVVSAALGTHSRTRSDMVLLESAGGTGGGAAGGESMTDLSLPARAGSTEALNNGHDAGAAAVSPTSPGTPSAPGAPGPGLPTVVVPHRFSLLQPPSMDKCRLCKKRFGMHRRLVCDDCGYACHRKCVTLVPPSCELKGGIKHYHERYLEDMQRRAGSAGQVGAGVATSPSRPSGSTPV